MYVCVHVSVCFCVCGSYWPEDYMKDVNVWGNVACGLKYYYFFVCTCLSQKISHGHCVPGRKIVYVHNFSSIWNGSISPKYHTRVLYTSCVSFHILPTAAYVRGEYQWLILNTHHSLTSVISTAASGAAQSAGLSELKGCRVTVVISLSPPGTHSVTMIRGVKHRHVIFDYSMRHLGTDTSVCATAVCVLWRGGTNKSLP